MWWTPEGQRVLTSAEGVLFREGLASLIDHIEIGESVGLVYEVGISVFDDLTHSQKLAMLAVVGSGLLDGDVPLPELTAVLEGAVAAVFNQVMICLKVEIEIPDGDTDWRAWVRNAYLEVEAESETIPDVASTDPADWDFLVEVLSSRILWDSDYEFGQLLDLEPYAASAVRSLMGISDRYTTEVAPDPAPHDLHVIRTGLRVLTGP